LKRLKSINLKLIWLKICKPVSETKTYSWRLTSYLCLWLHLQCNCITIAKLSHLPPENIQNGRCSGDWIPALSHNKHCLGTWQVHFDDKSGIMEWQQLHLFAWVQGVSGKNFRMTKKISESFMAYESIDLKFLRVSLDNWVNTHKNTHILCIDILQIEVINRKHLPISVP
jgi:hypothetical protein